MGRSFKTFLSNQFWLIPVGFIVGVFYLIAMPDVAHAIGKALVYLFFVMNAFCLIAIIPIMLFSPGITRKDLTENALVIAFFGLFLLGGFFSSAFFFRIQGFEFLRWSERDAVAVCGSLFAQAFLGACIDYFLAYILGGIALLFRRGIVGIVRACRR